MKISPFTWANTFWSESYVLVEKGSNDGINTNKVEQKGGAAKTMPNLLLCLGPDFIRVNQLGSNGASGRIVTSFKPLMSIICCRMPSVG